MKTCKKLCLLTLCLFVLSAMLTVGVAAEVDPLDCLIRDEFGLETHFDVILLESLDELASSGTENFLIDVRELAQMECYEIIYRNGYEETVYGAIYLMNGEYYYLNYVNLGNQHFDADGYFSYRSGEVMLTRAETYRDGIKNALYPLTEEFWSGAAEETVYGEEVSMIFFWIGFVLLGFVTPIPFFVLGILLSRSKKLGYPKYWLILTYIAAAWFVLSALLLLLLMIA